MSRDDVNEVCNVRVVARCSLSGDVLAERIGHNVWTTTGREYSCMLKTFGPNGTPLRNDRIAYVGLGSGNQPESVSVARLVTPLAWATGRFLKPLAHELTTFPSVVGARTAVRYVVRYGFDDVSLNDSTAHISECGLFTNGEQRTFQADGRDVRIQVAEQQSPVAYHTFDPIPKSPNTELEIIWELRH